MFKLLSRTILFLVILAVGNSLSAQNASDTYPFLYDRQIVSNPRVDPPREAVESGLRGVVSVSVTVDAMGNVVAVNDATGPGSVCRQITRSDVVAMREAAAEAAKLVKFAPVGAGGPELSRSWVRFDFPSSGKVAPVAAASVTKDPADGDQDKSSKEGTRFTVKGDRNYSASVAPPPDYKGPVNTSGSATSSSSKSDKYTVMGDGNYSAAEAPAPGYTETGKKLSGGVLNGKAASLPKPPYPRAAWAVRASGAVSVQVLIDTNGEVFSAQAVSGHPLLRSAATTAACGATFWPTLLESIPVKVSGVITYNFVP